MLIDFGRENQVKSGKSDDVTGMNNCLLSMNLNLMLRAKIGFDNINLVKYCFHNRKLLT